MYVGFLAAMFAAWRLPGFEKVFAGATEPLGVVMGATIIALIGFVDDMRDLSPPAKLAGTILGATVMASQGVQMTHLRIPFWDVISLDASYGLLLTVVWVLVVTQAINLIDGLDGLAAGICAIAGAAYFFYARAQVDVGLLGLDSLGPLLACVVVAVTVGFLPHNAHPAKIFMGDVGALFLGVLMASATLVVGGRTGEDFTGQTFFFFAPAAIPFIILGVPLLDTALSFLRRVRSGKSWAVADKEHIHHRLLRLGHGHRRAVFILWLWTLVLAALAVLPAYAGSTGGVVLPGVVALGIILYLVLHPRLHRGADDDN